MLGNDTGIRNREETLGVSGSATGKLKAQIVGEERLVILLIFCIT